MTVSNKERSVEQKWLLLGTLKIMITAALPYYYDHAILRNKLTPLSIFRDLALRKRDSKEN